VLSRARGAKEQAETAPLFEVKSRRSRQKMDENAAPLTILSVVMQESWLEPGIKVHESDETSSRKGEITILMILQKVLHLVKHTPEQSIHQVDELLHAKWYAPSIIIHREICAAKTEEKNKAKLVCMNHATVANDTKRDALKAIVMTDCPSYMA